MPAPAPSVPVVSASAPQASVPVVQSQQPAIPAPAFPNAPAAQPPDVAAHAASPTAPVRQTTQQPRAATTLHRQPAPIPPSLIHSVYPQQVRTPAVSPEAPVSSGPQNPVQPAAPVQPGRAAAPVQTAAAPSPSPAAPPDAGAANISPEAPVPSAPASRRAYIYQQQATPTLISELPDSKAAPPPEPPGTPMQPPPLTAASYIKGVTRTAPVRPAHKQNANTKPVPIPDVQRETAARSVRPDVSAAHAADRVAKPPAAENIQTAAPPAPAPPAPAATPFRTAAKPPEPFRRPVNGVNGSRTANGSRKKEFSFPQTAEEHAGSGGPVSGRAPKAGEVTDYQADLYLYLQAMSDVLGIRHQPGEPVEETGKAAQDPVGPAAQMAPEIPGEPEPLPKAETVREQMPDPQPIAPTVLQAPDISVPEIKAPDIAVPDLSAAPLEEDVSGRKAGEEKVPAAEAADVIEEEEASAETQWTQPEEEEIFRDPDAPITVEAEIVWSLDSEDNLYPEPDRIEAAEEGSIYGSVQNVEQLSWDDLAGARADQGISGKGSERFTARSMEFGRERETVVGEMKTEQIDVLEYIEPEQPNSEIGPTTEPESLFSPDTEFILSLEFDPNSNAGPRLPDQDEPPADLSETNPFKRIRPRPDQQRQRPPKTESRFYHVDRGVRFCEMCGSRFPQSGMFCPSCGARVNEFKGR